MARVLVYYIDVLRKKNKKKTNCLLQATDLRQICRWLQVVVNITNYCNLSNMKNNLINLGTCVLWTGTSHLIVVQNNRILLKHL